MSIVASLLNSAKALSIHSKGAEIAGRNIANVNNPEYARQQLIIKDQGSIGRASNWVDLGIKTEEIRNVRNSVLDAQIIREQFSGGSLEMQSQFLRTMESILGEQLDRSADSASSLQSPDALLSPSGISNAIDQFYNAFSEVAANPTDDSQKAVLLEKAAVLTDRFHTIDQQLTQTDANINTQINQTVDEANELLAQIATLNAEITRLERTTGRAALELRDDRQGRLEELGQLMNFETQQLSTSSGHLNVFVRDSSNNPVLLVDGLSQVASMAYDGTNFTAGSSATNVTITGGEMYGAHSVRTNELATLRTDLDSLARGFVTEVNSAYNPSGTGGEDFFVAANLTAGDIAVTGTLTASNLKTTNSGDAGANELALAVADLMNKDVTFSNSFVGTFNQHMVSIATDLGASINTIELQRENQSVVEGMLKQERDALIGVSMDEEITDIIRYQRAFQASARVISTMDTLLDTVVNGLKR